MAKKLDSEKAQSTLDREKRPAGLKKKSEKQRFLDDVKKAGIALPQAQMHGFSGRTEKEIDWELASELLRANCTGVQVAARFNMHHQTFYDRVQKEFGVGFTEFANKKKEEGNTFLHQAQYELAREKDKTMLVWLGKQRLSQRDNPSHDQAFDAKLANLLDKLNRLEVPKSEEIKKSEEAKKSK